MIQKIKDFFTPGDSLHILLGSHDRLDDKFNTKQQCHKGTEISHGPGRYDAGYIASDDGKDQHHGHHQKSVFDIQIIVLFIGVCGDRAGQHIG